MKNNSTIDTSQQENHRKDGNNPSFLSQNSKLVNHSLIDTKEKIRYISPAAQEKRAVQQIELRSKLITLDTLISDKQLRIMYSDLNNRQIKIILHIQGRVNNPKCNYIYSDGVVTSRRTYKDLAIRFKCSEMTIHRDMKKIIGLKILDVRRCYLRGMSAVQGIYPNQSYDFHLNIAEIKKNLALSKYKIINNIVAFSPRSVAKSLVVPLKNVIAISEGNNRPTELHSVGRSIVFIRKEKSKKTILKEGICLNTEDWISMKGFSYEEQRIKSNDNKNWKVFDVTNFILSIDLKNEISEFYGFKPSFVMIIAERFRKYHFEKGTKIEDVDAAFRDFVRNGKEKGYYNRELYGKSEGKPKKSKIAAAAPVRATPPILERKITSVDTVSNERALAIFAEIKAYLADTPNLHEAFYKKDLSKKIDESKNEQILMAEMFDRIDSVAPVDSAKRLMASLEALKKMTI